MWPITVLESWFVVRITGMHNPNGKLMGALFSFKLITKKKIRDSRAWIWMNSGMLAVCQLNICKCHICIFQFLKIRILLKTYSNCIVAALLIYGKLINRADSYYSYLHTVVINSTDSDYFDLYAGLCEWKSCVFHIYSFICSLKAQMRNIFKGCTFRS